MPSRLIAGLLLLAPLLSGADAAGPAAKTAVKTEAKAADPFAGVRLDSPRAGPGAKTLFEAARCLEIQDWACVDRLLPASDLIERVTFEDLAAAIPVEKSGLVQRYLTIARRGGEERLLRLLSRTVDQCRVALFSARHGRCDEGRRLPAPPSPWAAADESEDRAHVGPMHQELGRTYGRRQARRLVCGPLVVAEQVRIQEVRLVLGQSRTLGSPVILDLRCTDMETRSLLEDDPAGTRSPVGAEETAAVQALLGGMRCLAESSTSCQEAVAPLSGLLADRLLGPLDRVGKGQRQAHLDEARRLVARSPAERADLLRSYVEITRCKHLLEAPEMAVCTVGDVVDAPADPELPADLSPAERAQARALLALLWREYRELPKTAREVHCGGVSLTVVYHRPESEPPVLLDLRCRR